MNYQPKKMKEEPTIVKSQNLESSKEKSTIVEPIVVKEEPILVINPVNVIDGPIGKVIEFIDKLPKGYIVTNVVKAPTSIRKNGPMVSLAFVEKSSNFQTVIVHSENFEEAANKANEEVNKNGAEILHAYASPVSSRKRGRVAFGILIIMKKPI